MGIFTSVCLSAEREGNVQPCVLGQLNLITVKDYWPATQLDIFMAHNQAANSFASLDND